jgi:peroxiredoxin Q/BCP
MMASELNVGDKAPGFSLKTEDGRTVSLASLKGAQIVLYFYPKDDTPGCTKEACGFRDSITSMEKADAVVLGVSMDDADSHARFITKYGLPFPLLCDEDGTVSKAYGVYKKKNMYGKTYWGIERSTFIISETGKLKAIFRKVKVDGHVAEVRAALKG